MHKIVLGIGAGLLSLTLSCGSEAIAAKKVSYPKELQGVWQAAVATCKLPGDLDSDVRIQIKADKLIGYEHWSEPLSVTLISQKPKAWRIKSRTHIDDDARVNYHVYSVTGYADGALAVVDSSRAEVYTRCR